jgi:tRNA threonylcarbamoyladenosine biosynthesis protein TsaB
LRPDPTVLAFDTSAAHCAAALLSGGHVLASRFEKMGRGQAERLLPLLEEILGEASKDWSDLDAVGVGIGPGNFTGIRISVSAARGIALAREIPAIGVSALEAQAFGLEGPVISTIAGPRDVIYLQFLGAGNPSPPMTVTLEDLPPLPDHDAWVCVGAEAAGIAARYGGRAAGPAYPLAEAIARIAASRAGAPQPRPAPLYLRPVDAAPPSDPPPAILP